MAISANGIIARENNEEDFLSRKNWNTLVELAHKAGRMIWGRKTYEVVQTWEKEYQEEIKDVKKVIVSSDPDFDPGESYELVSTPKDAIKKLSGEGFSEAILSGGAKLNTSFAKDSLIDEIILNIDSVIIGKGIPLFLPDNFDLDLKLLGTKRFGKNIVQLHYEAGK